MNVVTVIRWNWSIKEFCGNMRCFRQNYLRKTNNCFIDCYFLFKFHESVDYRLPLSRLTSLNIGCTRHSQASLTLLSFARYFGIIQTSLASALVAPSVVRDNFREEVTHMSAYLFIYRNVSGNGSLNHETVS